MFKKTCCLLLCIIMLTGLFAYASIESAQWDAVESNIVISGTADDSVVTMISYIADAENELGILPDGDVTGTILHTAEIIPVNGNFEYAFKVLPGDDVICVVVEADGSKETLYCHSENYIEGLVDSISDGTAEEIKAILENEVNFKVLRLDDCFNVSDISEVYTKLEGESFTGTAMQKLNALQTAYLQSTFFLSPDTQAMKIAEDNGLYSKLDFDDAKIKYYTKFDENEKAVVISRVAADDFKAWVNSFYTELALYCVYDLTYGYMEDIGEKIYFEKDINLDVSQKLEMIFNLHGVNTDMTRREDISLGENTSTSLRKRKVADLEKRVEKILSNSNATVISIHQNSFPQDARCSGAQVFYSENNIKSEFLAKRVQSCLKHGIDNSNTRQEKIADKSIFLLKKVMCPAILVECGFLSNPNELVLLNDESYRMKLAMCIASGFFEYKKEM